MDNIDEIYRNLTGVDIDTQRMLWDERGKGYYGEYLVFRELYPSLTGCCKILMNLQIPTGNGQTTEIDLLLIHETGLYVFEMKHYKGTIYGKPYEKRWTQYFRTAPNVSFHNPVLQNQYHIAALRNRFPGIPVHSFIVFTNADCDLRVECNDSNVTICELRQLYSHLYALETSNKIFDSGMIDNIFKELASFAPILPPCTSAEGEAVPFHEYINRIVSDLRDSKESAQATYLAMEKHERRKTSITMAAAAFVCVLSIVLALFGCHQYQTHAATQIQAAEQALNEFAQKFEHVEPYNNGDLTLTANFITASNVCLDNSADLSDTVNLSFDLTWNGELYIAQITRDTMLNVILTDGSVREYSLTENTFPYSNSNLHIGKGNSWYSAYKSYSFPVQQLFGIRSEDVAYIKLVNIDILVTDEGSYKPAVVGTGYEIQIYS